MNRRCITMKSILINSIRWRWHASSVGPRIFNVYGTRTEEGCQKDRDLTKEIQKHLDNNHLDEFNVIFLSGC